MFYLSGTRKSRRNANMRIFFSGRGAAGKRRPGPPAPILRRKTAPPHQNVAKPLQSVKSTGTGKYPIHVGFRYYNAAICYLTVSDGKTP